MRKIPYETVEDFFWEAKAPYEPLYLIGRGLLDIFDHPDAVYIKDLRVLEERSRVRIYMVVHNSSEYDYESDVIESYYLDYDRDDVIDYLVCQGGNSMLDVDQEYLEEYMIGTALMSSYKDQFYNSKTIIWGYTG